MKLKLHYFVLLFGLTSYAFSGPVCSNFDECRELAESGDSNSQMELGMIYATGNGVEKDFVKANVWFLEAALQGNKDGMFNLGVSSKQARS